MTGDLTIKGTTRPVALNVVKYGEFSDPMIGAPNRWFDQSESFRADLDMMLDGKFIVSTKSES